MLPSSKKVGFSIKTKYTCFEISIAVPETSVEFLKFRFRYKVMGDCWLSEPGMRPTFAELAEKIGEELQEGEQEVRERERASDVIMFFLSVAVY